MLWVEHGPSAECLKRVESGHSVRLSQRMRLDRLPRRITGFFDHLETPRSLDASAFKHACYLVAQMDGGSIEKIDFDLTARSYYAATLRTSTDHVRFCLTAYTPTWRSCRLVPLVWASLT